MGTEYILVDHNRKTFLQMGKQGEWINELPYIWHMIRYTPEVELEIVADWPSYKEYGKFLKTYHDYKEDYGYFNLEELHSIQKDFQQVLRRLDFLIKEQIEQKSKNKK